MERLYPVFIKLSGLPCLVAGGGAVATRKVRRLLSSGAKITVISPACSAELISLAQDESIHLEHRKADPSDVVGFQLVICATSDSATNRALALAAKSAGILVNVVDAPELSSFFVPAVVDRERLQVAISTSGSSPALAKRLRQEIEEHFGPEYQMVLEIEAFLRPQIIGKIPAAHRPAVFRLLAERLPEACQAAKSSSQLRADLSKLLGFAIPIEFEQLVSQFFR